MSQVRHQVATICDPFFRCSEILKLGGVLGLRESGRSWISINQTPCVFFKYETGLRIPVLNTTTRQSVPLTRILMNIIG